MSERTKGKMDSSEVSTTSYAPELTGEPIELGCVEEIPIDYKELYYRQERELRELHYKFLKELGTSLPVGLPKISTVEAYGQIFEIMHKERVKLLTAARIMHFDLIALGGTPLAEMVDMFGNGEK